MSFATPGQENAAQIEQPRMRVFIVILVKTVKLIPFEPLGLTRVCRPLKAQGPHLNGLHTWTRIREAFDLMNK